MAEAGSLFPTGDANEPQPVVLPEIDDRRARRNMGYCPGTGFMA
jgi:hypothetical protein